MSATLILVVVIMCLLSMSMSAAGLLLLEGECSGDDENGIYKKNEDGTCVLESCKTGWTKSGETCIKKQNSSGGGGSGGGSGGGNSGSVGSGSSGSGGTSSGGYGSPSQPSTTPPPPPPPPPPPQTVDCNKEYGYWDYNGCVNNAACEWDSEWNDECVDK